MTPDNGQDAMNPENLPPAPAPVPTAKVFSEAEAQAALARLKAKAAAQQAAAAAPPQSAPPEAVEMTAVELAANPEEAHRRFDAAVAGLRAAFARFVAAKEAQFEQVADLGWSGEHEDVAAFLKHLEQEHERLQLAGAQTDSDIDSTTGAMELEDWHEKLAHMKSVWAKLRAEGVPRDQWPLDAELTWADQFQVQAELCRDPETRKP